MAKREQTEIDEERLKAMIAGEVSSYRRSTIDNTEVSEEKAMPVKKEDRAEQYESAFLSRKESVHRKQTYISYDIYRKLARILPLLSDDMTVPAFLYNVLSHHLETYSEELGELFRMKTQKTF